MLWCKNCCDWSMLVPTGYVHECSYTCDWVICSKLCSGVITVPAHSFLFVVFFFLFFYQGLAVTLALTHMMLQQLLNSCVCGVARPLLDGKHAVCVRGHVRVCACACVLRYLYFKEVYSRTHRYVSSSFLSPLSVYLPHSVHSYQIRIDHAVLTQHRNYIAKKSAQMRKLDEDALHWTPLISQSAADDSTNGNNDDDDEEEDDEPDVQGGKL